MVMYTENKDLHNADTIRALNELRSTYHDCTLAIGNQTVNAHKNILVIKSDYFRALFVGPLADTDKSEVDLSTITNDISAVKSVVDFMYSGEIEIDETNYENLMKLSAYLLISKLQKYCEEFIVKSVDINSCINFYFVCMKNGFSDLEDKIFRIVKSRFNDYLISTKELAKLEHSAIKSLFDKGAFEYCTIEKVLNFLLLWIDNNSSEEVLNLALDIVKHFEARGNTKVCIELSEEQKAIIEKLERENAESVNGKSLLEKIYIILGSYKPVKETKPKDLHIVKGFRDVIITLTPRRCLIEKRPINFKIPRSINEPVLDICAYVPSEHSWYVMNQFYDRGVISDLLEDSCDNGYLFVDRNVFYMHYKDLAPVKFKLFNQNPQKTEYNHDHISRNQNEFLHSTESHLVAGKDKTVYVVHRIDILRDMDDDDEDISAYFQCCKLHGSKWKPVFSSDVIGVNCDGTHSVALSSASCELLIIYYFRGLVSSYVADMSVGVPIVSQIAPTKDPHASSAKDYKDIRIIEGKDRFFVVEVGEEGKCIKVVCTYQYRYKSCILEPGSGSEILLNDVKNDFDKHAVYPCCLGLTVSNQSIWIFSGNRKYASSLTEIVIDDCGKLEARTHPPPPFSYTFAGFPATISKKSLVQKKPITEFRQLQR